MVYIFLLMFVSECGNERRCIELPTYHVPAFEFASMNERKDETDMLDEYIEVSSRHGVAWSRVRRSV